MQLRRLAGIITTIGLAVSCVLARHVAVGEEVAAAMPTSLTCNSNAKTVRDYSFGDKRWEGDTRAMGSPFGVPIEGSRNLRIVLRSKVFSDLDQDEPRARSIIPDEFALLGEPASEFDARVV